MAARATSVCFLSRASSEALLSASWATMSTQSNVWTKDHTRERRLLCSASFWALNRWISSSACLRAALIIWVFSVYHWIDHSLVSKKTDHTKEQTKNQTNNQTNQQTKHRPLPMKKNAQSLHCQPHETHPTCTHATTCNSTQSLTSTCNTPARALSTTARASCSALRSSWTLAIDAIPVWLWCVGKHKYRTFWDSVGWMSLDVFWWRQWIVGLVVLSVWFLLVSLFLLLSYYFLFFCEFGMIQLMYITTSHHRHHSHHHLASSPFSSHNTHRGRSCQRSIPNKGTNWWSY